MNTLNAIPLNKTYGNTGIGKIYFNPGAIKSIYVCPSDFVLSGTAIATPAAAIAALAAAAQSDDPLSRIFPINNLVALADSSEAIVREKMASGADVSVRYGTYTHGWRIRKGGLSLLRRLQFFNPYPDLISLMWLDANGFLFGSQATDSEGNQGMGGATLEDWFADKWKFNDFSKTTELIAYYNMFPEYINGLLTYIGLGTSVNMATTVFGLQDIALQASGATVTSGSYSVQVVTAEPAANITSKNSTALAAPSMYTVTNAATGKPIAFTAATYDATNQAITIVCTKTDPNYPIAEGSVAINLVGPTEMATGNMPGYESSGPVILPVS